MSVTPLLGSVFVGVAVIFLGVAFQNFLVGEQKLTPQRKTWLRVSFVFAGIGIALCAVSHFRS